mgnify:FL=1
MVSKTRKRIAIVDLCRPADIYPDQLSAAGIRKQQKYDLLIAALRHYTDRGWLVHVYPWVVGFRGFIDIGHIGALLDFLNIPKQQLRVAVERSVVASVKALHFMHCVRFGGGHRTRHVDMDQEQEECDDVCEMKADKA